MRTNFYYKPVNKMERYWVTRLHTTLIKRFGAAANSSKFIDNHDWLEGHNMEIQIFVPENLQSVHSRYSSVIRYVSEFFECIPYWATHITGTDTIKTFHILGYGDDVDNCMRTLKYIIDHFNALQVFLVREYRYNKKKAREFNRPTNKIDARVRARMFIDNKVEALNNMLPKYIEREYSVLHRTKMGNLEQHLLSFKNLDYRKYHYKRKLTIRDAYSRPGTITINRIVR